MSEVVGAIQQLESVAAGHLRFTVEGPVATLVFSRPQARNALTRQMYRDLDVLLHLIATADTFRALILTSARRSGRGVSCLVVQD